MTDNTRKGQAARDHATKLLVNYLYHVPGLNDRDCYAEIAEIADSIIEAATEQIKAELPALVREIVDDQKPEHERAGMSYAEYWKEKAKEFDV